jgi:AcrR family transcriptional regulator
MTELATTGAGRPRDPAVEERVRSAACQLYARVGWTGFSIDAVAREARVGKSSIYLRWPDTTSLLLDSLQTRIDMPLDIDTGNVRGDLLALAQNILGLLTSDMGDSVLRLAAEARSVPELAPRWEDFVAANVSAVRRITRRGISRGDLPPRTPVTLLLDALFGGLLMHYMTTSPDRATMLGKRGNELAESLVDMVLSAVTV